ncbi:hypothetical protein MKW98_006592 [Papaver atlanticum]|uniref:Uncharacterized protein n=1 Tax=Papaver atlanticum TaxID=357466 RepID=A0AAD4T9K5_9MAGN|nr:hypothetical protein MKW98_006592 [Papaver atlanticum]
MARGRSDATTIVLCVELPGVLNFGMLMFWKSFQLNSGRSKSYRNNRTQCVDFLHSIQKSESFSEILSWVTKSHKLEVKKFPRKRKLYNSKRFLGSSTP